MNIIKGSNINYEDLEKGNMYIIIMKGYNDKYFNYYTGVFNCIHTRDLCTLYEFINIKNNDNKYKKIQIIPNNSSIHASFYNYNIESLQYKCLVNLTKKQQIWLNNNNHTINSLGIYKYEKGDMSNVSNFYRNPNM
jgi:hypothetical protein